MSLVLLNFGLDELGNPRLRAAPRAVARIGAAGLAADGPDAGVARGAGARRGTPDDQPCERPGAPVLDIRDLSIAYAPRRAT